MRLTKLETIIKEIARIYFVSLNYQRKERISSGEIDPYSPFQKYISDVEWSFSMLNKENKRIITNEYFYDGYPYWWLDLYKEEDFKKKKKIAIKKFVETFYEIH